MVRQSYLFNDLGSNDIVVAVASSKLHNGCGHDENGNGDDDDNDSINIKSSNNICCSIRINSIISSRIIFSDTRHDLLACRALRIFRGLNQQHNGAAKG